MKTNVTCVFVLGLLPALAACISGDAVDLVRLGGPAPGVPTFEDEGIQVHYLEVVTPDVDATCAALEELHGVTFGEPVAELGKARTAALEGGARIGVRAPMHAGEEPVVRPYVLVDDLESAVQAARDAGGQIAVPPMEIPGQGRFALYFLAGNQYGLWQL